MAKKKKKKYGEFVSGFKNKPAAPKLPTVDEWDRIVEKRHEKFPPWSHLAQERLNETVGMPRTAAALIGERIRSFLQAIYETGLGLPDDILEPVCKLRRDRKDEADFGEYGYVDGSKQAAFADYSHCWDAWAAGGLKFTPAMHEEIDEYLNEPHENYQELLWAGGGDIAICGPAIGVTVDANEYHIEISSGSDLCESDDRQEYKFKGATPDIWPSAGEDWSPPEGMLESLAEAIFTKEAIAKSKLRAPELWA